MTNRDAFSLALKVLGVVYVVLGLSQLALILEVVDSLGSNPPGSRQPWYVAGEALAVVVLLATAVILLDHADRIARRLVPNEVPLPGLGEPGWEQPLFSLALRVFGVVCLVHGAARLAAEYVIFRQAEHAHQLEQVSWGEVGYAAVRVLAGLYLLSGAARLVTWLLRAPPDEDGPDDEAEPDYEEQQAPE